ncbi:ATP-grasp peptide maturase system methyltransferase [Streptosporangium sp. NPDC002544]|uniref:ATP-grasp peptide maturase system methyltransferase n=1 Tax=Streptosporangium sp. NPDC002544 TaxID=3154538 RepID=UPI00332D20D7
MTAHGTPVLAARLRRDLADRLARAGCLRDPAWRNAVESVAREPFLGSAIARATEYGDRWEVVRREEMTGDEWLKLVYRVETWVTQVDGVMVEEARGLACGAPTSSSTMPGLVVRMLEAARISGGEKVLEIGTGTGYSTALMCHRLGDKAVTSIEYDQVVAGRTRDALATAGYAPTLVVGDGLAGYPGNAEYDRLIATCSVRHIPIPWMWQVRDGGTITAPLSGWMGGVAFAHLTLADDGTASGRFLEDDVYFMTARPHGPPPMSSPLLGIGDGRSSLVDPRVLDDPAGLFVGQLAAPSAVRLGGGEEVALLDVATGSQATTRPDPAGGWTVRQHGPLRLWDAVEGAVLLWQGAGSPHQSAYGLTVSGERQCVWLGDPGGPSWDLPA